MCSRMCDWQADSSKYAVGVGSDHGGLELKVALVEWLKGRGVEVVDMGPLTKDPEDDYTDYAMKVCKALLKGEITCGVLICKSGIGMSIAIIVFLRMFCQSDVSARLAHLFIGVQDISKPFH